MKSSGTTKEVASPERKTSCLDNSVTRLLLLRRYGGQEVVHVEKFHAAGLLPISEMGN